MNFHINPTTGNPSPCSAKHHCPFGDMEADHYSTRAEAQAGFESKMTTFDLSGKNRLALLKKKVVRKNDLDYDTIEYELKHIEEWEQPWTPSDEKNMALIHELSTVVEREPFTSKDQVEARLLMEKLDPYFKPKRSGGWDSSDTSWRARDNTMHSLGESLIRRRLADALTYEPAEQESNERLIGLTEAQEIVLKNYNRPSSDFYKGVYIGEVESHFQEAIARVKRGDAPAPEQILESENHRSLLPDSERIFNKLHPDSPIYDQQLYLATVYPVNELKEEMDRVGVDNVSVTPFENGREWGNVYTVMQPNGSTRSFSVYEHRNTDSIIINGSSNWAGTGRPYAGDSKDTFFAEFAPEDRKRSAQALTFYMMQAQSGSLEGDDELASKVSKRDWNAILDASIPGFKAWRKSNIGDSYIAPKEESNEETLSRLDF